jgi:hypothetical protein
MGGKIDVTADSSSDSASLEERIRTRAYYLWENASEPKGEPDEYWDQASAEIQNDLGAGQPMKAPVEPRSKER